MIFIRKNMINPVMVSVAAITEKTIKTVFLYCLSNINNIKSKNVKINSGRAIVPFVYYFESYVI